MMQKIMVLIKKYWDILMYLVFGALTTAVNYLVYLPAGATFRPNDYLWNFYVGGNEVMLNEGIPKDFTLKLKGGVQTNTPGTYTVEYRMTYTERNENNPSLDRSWTGYSKLIVVVEG